MHTLNFLLDGCDFQRQMDYIILPFLTPLRKDFRVATADGRELAARIYSLEDAKATICICHGFCEYMDKYSEVIYNFLQAGYSVAICEHRGHGFSHRSVSNLSKVHIDSYDTYVSDYNSFVQAVAARMPAKPLYLFGHSMGGCIAALYLERYPDVFSAAILSSPMLEIDTDGKPAWLCRAYSKWMAAKGRGKEYYSSGKQDFDGTARFETSSASDKGRWQCWFDLRLAEPHYQTNSGTLQWVYASLEAIETAIQNAHTIQVPVLLCQAGHDNLIPEGGQNRFAVLCQRLTFRRFPFSKHEIFNADPVTRRAYWHSVLSFCERFTDSTSDTAAKTPSPLT